jgi:hypothetical protein
MILGASGKHLESLSLLSWCKVISRSSQSECEDLNGKIAIVMIFPHLIDQTRRFARVTLSGSVHGHQIAAAMEAMYQDPYWATEFDILWDASGITELLLDASDFLGFVRVQKKYAAVGPRREIIIARRNLDRAMAKTYAMFMKAGAHRVYVCQSEEEANELLKQ